MGEVKLGPNVIIHDAGDGIYDAMEQVTIHGEQGEITDPVLVTEALRKIGIGPLKSGVKLNPLANYVHSLTKAEKLAKEASADGPGILSVSAMVAELEQARGYAMQAGIPADENRIATINRTGFANVYEADIQAANNFSKMGDVIAMTGAIREARVHAQKANIALDAPRINEIARTGYVNGYIKTLDSAEAWANKGWNALAVKQALNLAVDYAMQAGISADTERIKRILERLN